MAAIDSATFDLSALDALARQDSFVHQLDPRAKLVTALAFIATVASFGKYSVSALLPYLAFPAALIAGGRLPLGLLARKLLVVMPFAVLIAAANPLLDREALLHLGPLAISGGWISCCSILLRFVLTVGVALILIATTSFPGLCLALEKLGAPRLLAVQLLLLYRYLFVLLDEALRMHRARALRAFSGRGLGPKVYARLVGQLLLRTLERARRIHLAMLCRGFSGEFPPLRQLHFGAREVVFTAGWCAVFLLLRLVNLPQLLGTLFLELYR